MCIRLTLQKSTPKLDKDYQYPEKTNLNHVIFKIFLK